MTDELMAAIRRADHERRSAEAALESAIAGARAAGRTWQQIGEVLGVSRQAAFKRFGTLDPHSASTVAAGPDVDPEDIVERVFSSLAEGDYPVIRGLMSEAAARALPRRKVLRVWRDVLARVGPLQGFSGHQTRTHAGEVIPGGAQQGPFVARVILEHETGQMVGHVSVNWAGRVDGLLIAPKLAEADLPF